MQNNQAFVARLKNIRPIEKADKIVQADVILNGIKITEVVVGVGTPEDTVIVYFDSNLCFGEKLVIDYPTIAGYVGKVNRRIKTIKLHGAISTGVAMEVEKFYKYFPTPEEAKKILVEGYAFEAIGSTEICHKYTPPLRNPTQGQGQGKGKKGKRQSRMIEGQFHFHIDTDQLLRNVFKLHRGQVISISRKIHGTSAICAYALVKKPLSLKEKIAKFFGVPVVESLYDYIYASRTVVKNDSPPESGFYKVDIWSEAAKNNFYGHLQQGETVYYEIVGYLPKSQTFIQKGYNYGCKEGDYKIAVYRITKTGPDGHVVEYSWAAMKRRCDELHVPTVEEYYYGRIEDRFPDIENDENWSKNFVERLKKEYLEKTAFDCSTKPPDEGIVLRIEDLGIDVYKLKSDKFLLRESKLSDEGEADIEEEEGSAPPPEDS